MMDPQKVQEMIRTAFPEARVEVSDMTGTGDHFDIRVTSKRFEGKSLIEQHQMVHKALEAEMDRGIHAVRITTKKE